MLKGIPNVLSPQLMNTLMIMGHGDELVLADGNFPANGLHSNCIYLSGHPLPVVLDAIIRFFPLDKSVEDNVILMAAPDALKPANLWDLYKSILNAHDEAFSKFTMLEKPQFYQRSKSAFAIVSTGETTRFADIIIRKGVVTPFQIPAYNFK
jgi:L-fucose mutarotase